MVADPTKKAKDSVVAATIIEGPIFSKDFTILYLVVPCSYFSKVLVIINILSTPIAKIRNGTTSNEIMVSPMSKYEIIPMEHKTDDMTMVIPVRPRTTPERYF